MKIIVTPECRHEDGWSDHGQPFTGQHVVVSLHGVCLDGEWVIRRDRRAIRNREPGHPWLTDNGHFEPDPRNIGWTTFRVEVTP